MGKLIASVAFLGLIAASPASADCAIYSVVAAKAYENANAYLASKWGEAARSAAVIFWWVADQSDCMLVKTMGTHMTKAGLTKGLSPSGPLAFPGSVGPAVSVGAGTVFQEVGRDAGPRPGPLPSVLFAPKNLMVDGIPYTIATEVNPNVTINSTQLQEILKDPSKASVIGKPIDFKALDRWGPAVQAGRAQR